MTLEEFHATYKPVLRKTSDNPLEEEHIYSARDVSDVKIVAAAQQVQPAHIWSFVDRDGYRAYVAGYRTDACVYGYIICEKPFDTAAQEVAIDDPAGPPWDAPDEMGCSIGRSP
jgi:hypothetical protein